MAQVFTDQLNFASASLGASIIFATDDFFAVAENLLNDDDPVWKETEFTESGKWMDGWETRRKRTEGNDWCIIELGQFCTVERIEADTMYFSGNFAPAIKVEGCEPTSDDLSELRALRATKKMGGIASAEEYALANKYFPSGPTFSFEAPLGAGVEATRYTTLKQKSTPVATKFIRVSIYPDGGVSRLRVYGRAYEGRVVHVPAGDMAAAANGGYALASSNTHYGHPRNLLKEGRGDIMSDGWETARNPTRGPTIEFGADGMIQGGHHEWSMLKMGKVGTGQGIVHSVEIDSHLFKGNCPESIEIFNVTKIDDVYKDMKARSEKDATAGTSLVQELIDELTSGGLPVLLPRTKLTAHTHHKFEGAQLANLSEPCRGVLVKIFPDGGIMRVRIYSS